MTSSPDEPAWLPAVAVALLFAAAAWIGVPLMAQLVGSEGPEPPPALGLPDAAP